MGADDIPQRVVKRFAYSGPSSSAAALFLQLRRHSLTVSQTPVKHSAADTGYSSINSSTIHNATSENVPSDMRVQRICRSACAFVQSDQTLHGYILWLRVFLDIFYTISQMSSTYREHSVYFHSDTANTPERSRTHRVYLLQVQTCSQNWRLISERKVVMSLNVQNV